jgi:hypothetical protein
LSFPKIYCLMNHHHPLYFNNGRHHFLKQTALTVASLATPDFVTFAASDGEGNKASAERPWYTTLKRWGQVNITEKDPPQYDISWWRTFWKRTETQGIIVNSGGIVAYYPTHIPLHRQATYLQGRDLFGELCKAAHDEGLAVFARMDSNRAHEEFYKAHPDWFAIDETGKPYKAGDLYISCVNSPYYEEHIPAILKEIAERYHPEGFTDNSWSGLGRNSICFCDYCKKSFRDKTGHNLPKQENWDDPIYRQWIQWNYERRLDIWDLNNQITKAAGGKYCIWSGMNSGSVTGQSRSFRDYKEICKRADIIMLDHQARSDAGGFQHNGDVGKLVHGLLGWDKLVPESMGMYQAGRPWFRVASKPATEARMWMINGIAGGIQPWWHMISAYHEDRRMYHTPDSILKWHKANENFLINRKPVATIGVVWSQQNTDFYGRDNAEELVELPWRGMTQALIRARIPYLPVHADHIDRDAAQFSVLILPNLGALSDDQVNSIKRFVARGGNLIATGQSSLYNKWGEMRSDYALADLFGAHYVEPTTDNKPPAEKLANDAYHTYLRLTPELRRQLDGPHKEDEPVITGKRHAIFKGFDETDILPFGGWLTALRVETDAQVLTTFIPQFPVYPPETAWMREPVTNIPGIVINTKANGNRIAFIPADLDRQFGRFNLPDYGDLLKNIVHWIVKDNLPLVVEGAGLVDCQLYSQPNRLILHLVNLTSAATWRQPLDELISIGPLKIGVRLPDSIKGKQVRLLVSNQIITATTSKGWAHFEIRSILDHEVAVIS